MAKKSYWKSKPFPYHIPFITLSAFFTIVVVTLVLARCYVRLRIVNSFKIDDYLIVFALFWWLVNCALIVCLSIFEFWRYWEATNYGYNTLAQTLVCTLYAQNTISQMSIICSFRRFLPKERRWARRTTIALIVILIATLLVTIYFSVLGCRPFHILLYTPDFNRKIRSGQYHCHPPRLAFFLSGIPNCVLDFFIFIFPFWLLRHASLKRKTRYGLYCLFAFGGLALIISILRVVFTRQLMYQINYRYFMVGMLLSIMECNFVMIAAVLPTMPPLYRRLKGSWRRHTDEEGAVEIDEGTTAAASDRDTEVEDEKDDVKGRERKGSGICFQWFG